MNQSWLRSSLLSHNKNPKQKSYRGHHFYIPLPINMVFHSHSSWSKELFIKPLLSWEIWVRLMQHRRNYSCCQQIEVLPSGIQGQHEEVCLCETTIQRKMWLCSVLWKFSFIPNPNLCSIQGVPLLSVKASQPPWWRTWGTTSRSAQSTSPCCG